MIRAEKLPSGNWRARASKTINGKRVFKSFTSRYKKDAESKATLWQASENRQIKEITLKQAYYNYIDAKSNILSPNTLREYQRAMYNDFPDLLDHELVYIDNHTVQKEINRLTAINSPKTVRNKYNFLKAVISYNNGNEIDIALPQRKKTEIHVPSEEEIKAIYQVVQGTIMELPFLLASQCGLRAGEICGLYLSDMDIKHNTIRISRSLANNGSKWILKAPKSYKSNRVIPCNEYIIELAQKTKPHRKELGTLLGLTINDITHRWNRITKNASIDHFNFHALRHYYCSQALLLNIPRQYIIELMGHSSSRLIEQVYGHTFPEKKYEFAKELIEMLDSIK